MMRSERKTEKWKIPGKWTLIFLLILLAFYRYQNILAENYERQVVSWIGQTEKDRTVSAFTEPDEEAYQKGCEALKEAGYEETGKIWLEKRIRSYGIGVFVAAIGILCIVGLLTELHMEKRRKKALDNQLVEKDRELEAKLAENGYSFSSANSINIGRLVPQIVYYVYAYARLYKNGVIAKDEKINVVVPTGNFGNILAAFYAKNMGLPIGKLICASNENKVLFDFFSTGTYDRNREFILTSSPSMDILISSNLERLIYRIAGNDAEANAKLMASLSSEGKYAITDEMKAQLADFYGNYTSEDETASTIKKLYEDTGYIIDTHTAVAAGVYDKYKAATGDTETKTVIASTASPFKFTRSVMDAIDEKYDSMTDFELVDELSKIGNVAVPQAIEEIRNAKVLHDTVCEVEEMPQVVKKFLGV